jgi:TatD DNase family protein
MSMMCANSAVIYVCWLGILSEWQMNIIDTHCHLDAADFDADREQVLQQAIDAGVSLVVVPAVTPSNFSQVIALSAQHPQCCYALGMHPMYIDNISPSDVARLSSLVSEMVTQDNKLVAIGEIGLDFYVTKQNKETQEYFFSEQLKIAQANDLPVILHVRRAIDDVLKHLRRTKVKGGIAHAFNGSMLKIYH